MEDLNKFRVAIAEKIIWSAFIISASLLLNGHLYRNSKSEFRFEISADSKSGLAYRLDRETGDVSVCRIQPVRSLEYRETITPEDLQEEAKYEWVHRIPDWCNALIVQK